MRSGSSWSRLARALVTAAFALALAAAPAAAQDDPPADAQDAPAGGAWQDVKAVDWGDLGAKAFDVFPLRLFTLTQTVVGFALFFVAGPLSAPSGAVDDAWDIFVATPYEETFQRPLGRF